MKRKIVMVLAMSLMLGVTACGQKNAEEKQEPAAEKSAEDETEETSEGSEDTADAEAEDVKKGKMDEGFLEEYWEPSKQDAETVSLGEEVTVEDGISFVLEDIYWAADLLPEKTDSSYNYIKGAANKEYLILKGKVTNLSSDTIFYNSSLGALWDAVGTVFLFDDSYAWYGGWYVGSDSISYRQEPGAEDTLYVAVLVPEELKEECQKVQILTGFSDLHDEIDGQKAGENAGIDWSTVAHKYIYDVMLP